MRTKTPNRLKGLYRMPGVTFLVVPVDGVRHTLREIAQD